MDEASVGIVARLSDARRDDVAWAGGKGANLGELVQAGFPVPDGFIVTTTAYRHAVAGIVRETSAVGDADDGTGAAMRAAVRQVSLPADVARAIAEAYAQLGGGAVAVRSSATAEDLPGAAFAGQQDTFLGVVGAEDVQGAVRECWASLWNERAIAYRRRLGIDDADVAIAVVVQRMVPAETAGVVFTADPVSGACDRMIVDAGEGLGEAVVSGLVTPDHIVMTRTGRVLSYATGTREVVFRSRADGSVGKTVAPSAGPDAVSGAEAHAGSRAAHVAPTRRLLDADALARLAAAASAVEDLFGVPQDIEWAIAGGSLHILQARPMTALPRPQKLNRVQRLIGSVFSDYFSVRPYPLDMTTWVPHGPVGMMDDIIGGLGIRAHLDGILPEENGVVVQFVPPMPTPTWRVLGLPLRVLRRARRYDPAAWTRDPRYLQFDRERERLLGVDVTALSWPELVETARHVMRLVTPVTALRAGYLPAFGLNIVRLRLALMRLGATRLLGALVSGAPTHTTLGNQRLEELADTVQADPQLARLFGEREADGVLTMLGTDMRFATFAADFDAYLAEFGYRETDSPVLISPPTWGDRPDIVIGLIAVMAAGGGDRTGAGAGGDRPDIAVDAEAELFAKNRLRDNPRRRARVRRLVQAARAGVGFREDSHAAFTRLAPVLRRTLLELGARLVQHGVLAEPFDVFHLRFDELEAVADPATTDPDRLQALARTARARAAAREAVASVPMVNYAAVFPPRRSRVGRSGAGRSGAGRSGAAADALLTGTPACAGQAVGPVRVIASSDDFARLQPGDVLVCPYTNPSWTPLFQRAAAVVADTGGIGSHAAIVARENGIPAVMGTGTGTRTLVDGQRVRVDGTAGTVTAA